MTIWGSLWLTPLMFKHRVSSIIMSINFCLEQEEGVNTGTCTL